MDENIPNLYLNQLNIPINSVKFGLSNSTVNNDKISEYDNVSNDTFMKQNSENNIPASSPVSSDDTFKKESTEIQSNFLNLTNKINPPADRRSENIPVSSDNRSSIVRREKTRIPQLSDDIYKLQTIYKDFIDNTSQVKTEVSKLDNSAIQNKKLAHAVFAALSPIISVRRVSSVPDDVEYGNYVRAAGIIGLAIANLPEDWRDIKSAGKQIFKGIKPDYDYKNYQHSFSFFRGTFLEPLLKIKGKFGERLGYFLKNSDKSLDKTKIGKFLSKIFKFKIDYEDPDLLKRVEKSGKIIFIPTYKVEGNFLGKLIGRSLLRIPLLSVIILGLLESPKIVKTIFYKKSTDNKFKTGTKQIVKSGIYVTSMLSNIGFFGALLAGFGPAGSLIGMGIGSIIGAKISQKINIIIDNKTN